MFPNVNLLDSNCESSFSESSARGVKMGFSLLTTAVVLTLGTRLTDTAGTCPNGALGAELAAPVLNSSDTALVFASKPDAIVLAARAPKPELLGAPPKADGALCPKPGAPVVPPKTDVVVENVLAGRLVEAAVNPENAEAPAPEDVVGAKENVAAVTAFAFPKRDDAPSEAVVTAKVYEAADPVTALPKPVVGLLTNNEALETGPAVGAVY